MRLFPNPDLTVAVDGRERWNEAHVRRASFHRLHEIVRYGISLRSSDVLDLEFDIDRRIGDMPNVRRRIFITPSLPFPLILIRLRIHLPHLRTDERPAPHD